ncbi:hypothetical protein DL93DRAFT_2160333 [Clavulina sp. PMI_390]|nr:hypothetical protein DL93DRAFT_2160333 [Clavulina sp. PMI_390]
MIPIIPSALEESELDWVLRSVHEPNAEVLRYVIARPSRAAVGSGLIIAVTLMGVVTVQLASYSSRFYKERKLVVIVVNGLFLYNLASLLCLGEALYHAVITEFSGGDGLVTLCQRYILLIVGNNFADALATYSLALPVASIFQNPRLGAALNILISIRLATSLFGARAIYIAIDSSTSSQHLSSPCKWIQSLILGTESIVCGLLLVASLRVIKHDPSAPHNRRSGIRDICRYALPSYLLTVACHFACASGVWCKSAFVTACFGIPLAAVSNVTLLAFLQANPSVFELSTGKQRQKSERAQHSSEIVVARDVFTESSHDGPLEIELTERLEVVSSFAHLFAAL